jgi:hypothetical protein
MKRFINAHKKALAAVAAIAVVAGSGIGAYAYFTASGAGTGTATVGSTSTWSVAKTGSAVGSMYPDHGSSVVTFTVTNNASGDQAIEAANLAATVDVDGSGNITQSGTPLVGCLQTWFAASAGTPASGFGASIDPGNSTTDAVTVTMSDSNSNQDVCKGATPDVTLTITHS